MSDNTPIQQQIAHERRKLWWFLAIVSIVIVLTLGSDMILANYGNPKILPEHNPLMNNNAKVTDIPQLTNTPTPTDIVFPTTAATSPASPRPCTMEAKLCPDGKTSVGRTGPNCEFAACPN